jgi:hypothetical protein
VEPLIPLSRAVASEVARLEAAPPAVVHIDHGRSVVIVEGLPSAEHCAHLALALGRAGLRYESEYSGQLMIYPS